MANFAVVDSTTNLVTNVIVVGPSVYKPDAGFVLVPNVPLFVQPGISWDGQKFIDPNASVAPSVQGVKTV